MKDQLAKIARYPGPEQVPGLTHRRQIIGGTDNQDNGFPANLVAHVMESVDMGLITTSASGPNATATGQVGAYAVTIDSTGTGTPAADGYTLTTAGTSGNKVLLRHVRRLASGGLNKQTMGRYVLALSAITTVTSFFGIFNSQADPVGTAPTNGVYFSVVNGALTAVVRGASGTAATITSFNTSNRPDAPAPAAFNLVAATNVELDLKFYNSGSASTSWGEFWVNGVRTAMTTAQITQLIALTGDLFNHIHVQTTSAAARSLNVDYAWAGYDR